MATTHTTDDGAGRTRMKAVSTVTWSEWNPQTRQMQHFTLHPAKLDKDGNTYREAEEADVPNEVVARVQQIRDRELKDHLSGRVPNAKAGHVRWVLADEYDEHISEVRAGQDPLSRYTDDEIRTWDADTAIANSNTVPGLAQRVLEVEKTRSQHGGRTRRAVVEHCERVTKAAEGGDVSLGDQPSSRLTPAEED